MQVFDSFVMDWIQQLRTPSIDLFMRGVALIGSGEACTLWAALIAIFLFTRRQAREAFFVFFGPALGGILVTLIKNLVQRIRPPLGHSITSYSFPSGHALAGVVFLGCVAVLFERSYPERRCLIWTLAIGGMLLDGINRVYLGVHWLTDVIAGWTLGALFLWLWVRKGPLCDARS